MINHFFSTSYPTIAIGDKGLSYEFEKIADDILRKTMLLDTDSVSNNALWRVAAKKAPASKKQEFKDCAIWETVLSVACAVQNSGMKMVFITVNTDDYLDKSKTPKAPYNTINP